MEAYIEFEGSFFHKFHYLVEMSADFFYNSICDTLPKKWMKWGVRLGRVKAFKKKLCLGIVCAGHCLTGDGVSNICMVYLQYQCPHDQCTYGCRVRSISADFK